MSGGALDYIYGRVEEVAFQIIRKATNPHQKAFGRHLLLVSQALHDVEWVFSGYYGEGDDLEAIQKVLPEGFLFESVLEDAKTAYSELGKLLAKIEKEQQRD